MALDPMAQDPAMDEAEPAAEPSTGGFCIEIKVSADGSIKVGVEPEAEETEEDAQGGEDYQDVPDIKAALKLAMQIFSGAGQMGASSSDQGQMDAAYESRQ